MSFADLGLSDQLLRAVTDSGYDVPTPIQKGAIPSVLMGKDLIGIAQTGTGKTASFVLPMIDILAEGRSRARMPRSPDPRADPRARRAGCREFREIRQVSQALDGPADRRRADGRPGQGAGKGRRRADRHAGPADGPVRPRQDHAQRLQPARHRRGRPHARHGLHPRHRGNLHQAAQAAPDPAVLGDHAAADQEAGRQVPDRPQDDRGRPPGDRQRQHRPAADRYPRRQEARRAAPHPARARSSRTRSSSATRRPRCASSTPASSARASRSARSRATWTRATASPSSTGSRRTRSTSWSRPTSPRAGST